MFLHISPRKTCNLTDFLISRSLSLDKVKNWLRIIPPFYFSTTNHKQQTTFHFPLSTFHFPLFTLHSPLFTLHSPLSTLHSSMLPNSCIPSKESSKILSVHNCL